MPLDWLGLYHLAFLIFPNSKSGPFLAGSWTRHVSVIYTRSLKGTHDPVGKPVWHTTCNSSYAKHAVLRMHTIECKLVQVNKLCTTTWSSAYNRVHA